MQPEQAAGPLAGLPIIPYVLIFLVFYFLVIRPQKNKQKELKELANNIAKNDQVVTMGGIHGTVVMVKEKTVVIRVDDSTKIEFDKEAVTTVIKTKN
ncbi:MAG: preprotein translocase subunit YajC [Candidatus Zapsychrus exili]|nr:preprotein translocase subunit YajC [Candidatus Zapsychrus exili]